MCIEVDKVLLLSLFITVICCNECRKYFPSECMFAVSPFTPVSASVFLPNTADSPGIFLPNGCPFHLGGSFRKVNGSFCSANERFCAAQEQSFQDERQQQVGFKADEVCGWQGMSKCLSGKIVFVLGDSMMRQLFVTLVSLYRGLGNSIVDYATHVQAVYRVCGEEDQFEYFGEPNTMLPTVPPTDLIDKHLSLSPLLQCSSKPTIVYNLFSPTFFDQSLFFRALTSHPTKDEILIVGVHFWEHTATVPHFYLGTLSELASRGNSVVIVGVPTIRVSPTDEGGTVLQSLQRRNSHLKSWVASQRRKGAPIYFLDFDFLAHLPNAPLGDTGNNWHYQCYLIPTKHQTHKSRNSWRVTWPNTTIFNEQIRMQGDGTCNDEMNREVWALIFKNICTVRNSVVN